MACSGPVADYWCTIDPQTCREEGKVSLWWCKYGPSSNASAQTEEEGREQNGLRTAPSVLILYLASSCHRRPFPLFGVGPWRLSWRMDVVCGYTWTIIRTFRVIDGRLVLARCPPEDVKTSQVGLGGSACGREHDGVEVTMKMPTLGYGCWSGWVGMVGSVGLEAAK